MRAGWRVCRSVTYQIIGHFQRYISAKHASKIPPFPYIAATLHMQEVLQSYHVILYQTFRMEIYL